MSPQAIDDAVERWSGLSGRLVTDETAELEMHS